METLILNGLKKEDNASHMVYEVLKNELEVLGYNVTSVILYDTEVADCLGCFDCWARTPGICIRDDLGRDIARMTVQSDILVLLTPVVFGGYSSELKKALDRLIPIISPFFRKYKGETHHKARYEKYPRFIGVGILPQYDEEKEKIFKTLVKRNSLNFFSPVYSTGIIISSEGTEKIREEIKKILFEAGMGN
ncbi:MAG: flavodoxin family protein [Promethearchaeota archaeon]